MIPFGQILRESLTDQELAYSAIRITGLAGVVVYLALVVASFVTGKPFDTVNYGVGLAAVIGSLGAAQRLTEPPRKETP